jgi:rhodanese-related sulfurtransferase
MDPESSATGGVILRISPAEAHHKMTAEGFSYIDVRTPEEFAEGHPEGALNVPLDDRFAEVIAAAFAKGAPLIVGCQAGRRSARAADTLAAAGFERVLDQRAGWGGVRGPFGEITEPGWAHAGLPQAIGSSAPLPVKR